MSETNIAGMVIAEEAYQKDYLMKTLDLRAAANAAKKEINVEIKDADLRGLMDSHYRMCFAKKVGDNDYNVVWQSYDYFSENNTFSYRPEYQAFRTDTFQAQVTVKVSSNPKDIGLGETTTIDKYGILSDATTGGDQTAITVNNDFRPTHIGISQVSMGINGTMISTPIYVSEEQCMLGNATFKPVEKVLIWFENNIETGTMFTNMRSRSIEIDLTNKNVANVRYEDGSWKVI